MSRTLGRRLARLLKERGMTQKDLAQATHLTEAAISRYISGKREPRAVTVANIAEALRVDPAEITGDDKDREVDDAIRLIARNAHDLSQEQREELFHALIDVRN